MTEYSKLSDAEIAEAVCKRLGWSGKNVDWGLGVPPNIVRPLCFDWTAPTMMQKVKEDLHRRKWGVQITSDNSDVAVSVIKGFTANGDADEVRSINLSEPRALYEAYLKATE